MKKFPSGGSHSPTMVANGSKRHPLHGHYSRLHRNPEEEALDLEDIVTVAPKAKGKKGRPALSASEKARRAEGKKSTPKATREKSEAAKIRSEVVKLLGQLQAASKTPAKKASESAKAAAKARKEAAKAKAADRVAKLKEQLKEAREKGAQKVPKHLPGLRIQPDLMEAIALAAAKKAAKASSGEKKSGGRKWTASQKAKAAATRAAKKSALVSNPGKRAPAESTKVGPYKITLLKNPLTDFSIGGVKVVPALAGAAGAIALIQLVSNLPWVAQMQEGVVKRVLPGAAAVVAGAVGLHFADKSKNSGMLKDMSKDLTAFGLFSALNGAAGATITELVDKVKSQPAAITTTTPAPAATKGGAFMSGGGWNPLNGYHLQGKDSGYPKAFLNGETGYFPDSNLALNGYHLAGDANSAQTAAAITALNGGAFKNSPMGGIDMSGFQD